MSKRPRVGVKTIRVEWGAMKKIATVIALVAAAGGCTNAGSGQAETVPGDQTPAKESALATSDSQLDSKSEEKPMIIDVRTPEEFAGGHLVDAVNFDVNDPKFQEQVKDLDRDGHYILYCRSGNRASGAKGYMESIGFKNVKNVGSVDQASQELGVDVVAER